MEENNTGNAVLYFRFTKWSRKNCPVSNTYNSIMDWCNKRKIKIIGIYEDNCKSNAIRRPDLKKMLECIESRYAMNVEMHIHYVVVPTFCTLYFDYEKVINLINKLRKIGIVIITPNQYYNTDLPEDLKSLKRYLDNRKVNAKLYGE